MGVRWNTEHEDAEKLVACIKKIVGSVLTSDIAEVVLRASETEKVKWQESVGIVVSNEFLLEGKPRSEYKEYCNMFNQFITGPAVEGREISELTEKYQKFYEIVKTIPLKAQESNKLENALYGVAIEAEMQGFIYGFKLFDVLLNKQLSVI